MHNISVIMNCNQLNLLPQRQTVMENKEEKRCERCVLKEERHDRLIEELGYQELQYERELVRQKNRFIHEKHIWSGIWSDHTQQLNIMSFFGGCF